MPFQDYSTTPASNTSINGINIAEGCASGNVNNALRQLAADGRTLYNTVSAISVANYMPLAGGVFTGNPTYSGRGGYIHHNDSGNTSGRVFIQASGGAAPSMSNGDWLLEY